MGMPGAPATLHFPPMSRPGAPNHVTIRPGAAALPAPAPPRLAGKAIVRRVHAHVPLEFFASTEGAGRTDWVARLRERYPAPLRKAMGYIRREGLRQTWAKIRTRSTLEKWSAAYGAFAAVGVLVEASPPAPPPGSTVMCWSWQGPLDADLHLVSPEQCLPVPELVRAYALAPLLGWIASVLRSTEGSIASCRLVGIDAALQAPLEEMMGPPDSRGKRVAIGWGAALTKGLQPGEVAVHLRPERAVGPLIARGPHGWVCRLPDPAHYFLDPYYPGPPETPEPFGREAVAEALAVLTRRLAGSGGAAVVPRPGALPARTLPVASRRSAATGTLGVSCLGAGNYVGAVLVHNLRRHARVLVRGVMDIRPEVAAAQARALEAAFCTTDPEAVLADAGTGLVLIASDHASHADYAVSALRAGKAVHLEKPPAVTADQLDRLLRCIGEVDEPRLYLGYNRPFAPVVIDLQKELDRLAGPTSVTFEVQGHRLGRAHWYRWPNQGTRIAGNLVHWIDLGYRLCGYRLPSWVEVSVPPDPSKSDGDAIVLSVEFDDGARVTIRFSRSPDETWGIREHVHVARQDLAAEIDDFRSLRISRAGRQQYRRYRRDKGHAGLMAALARRVIDREWDPLTVRDMARTCAIQFAAQAALANGGGRQSVDAYLPREGR